MTPLVGWVGAQLQRPLHNILLLLQTTHNKLNNFYVTQDGLKARKKVKAKKVHMQNSRYITNILF